MGCGTGARWSICVRSAPKKRRVRHAACGERGASEEEQEEGEEVVRGGREGARAHRSPRWRR